MRVLLTSLALLSLTACSRPAETQTASGCARGATHEVAWSNASSPDVVTATSSGPTCGQAVVTLVLRRANGDPLWAFASTHYTLNAGDSPPPEGLPAVSDADMDRFLAGWADLTEMRSGELPEWRADAASLTESATTFSYDTPFDRDVYENMRGRNLPMVCYAAAAEGSRCLIIDPATGGPTEMVAFGP